MPEIKNTFSKGKMNKDLDERIIPNGEYRDAMNIEVSTSEGSDVGTVQNILGNARIENVVGGGWTCVGAISDEKNDRFFWFITNPARDAILEYNIDGTTTPIIIDTNLNVLNFQDNIITGINIIDDILLWTDNHNEPRKINIERCKLGADATLPNSTHTKLVVNNNVTALDLAEEHITVIKKRPSVAPKLEITRPIGQEQLLATVALSQNNEGDFIVVAGDEIKVRIPRQFGGLLYFPATLDFSVGKTLLLSLSETNGTLPSNAQVVGTVTSLVETIGNPGFHTWTLDVVSISGDLPLDITTFTQNAGGIANSIIDEGTEMNVMLKLDKSNRLFEKKFVRFATRWQYEDGEYSAFSPFTDVAFNASRFDFHPTKTIFNLGMENNAMKITLTDLVTPDVPQDVVKIDVLIKPEDSTTVYSLDSIKPNDPPMPGESINNWNSIDYHSGALILTPGQTIGTLSASDISGSYSGSYEVTSESIYAALPANQTLRPWDNVPKKALAQEVTGNRVVYGNYTQGYNMLDGTSVAKPFLEIDYENRSFDQNDVIDFEFGRKSIKTFRTYQLGVVYGDEHGRETPVFTSQNSSLTIPWDSDETSVFAGNATSSNRLTAILRGNQPDFASYYKFFIKQNSGSYYNLSMDRIYRSENNENLWISFPSSDRNKLQEGEFIILKKQRGFNLQVEEDNKFKAIDIQAEAPDFIKYRKITIGDVGGTLLINKDLYTGYSTSVNIPEAGQTQIEVNKAKWTSFGGADLKEATRDDRIELSFSKAIGASVLSSETYLVAGLELTNNDTIYKITLDKPIKTSDDWVTTTPASAIIEDTLRLKIRKRVVQDGEQFRGRFFVKIIPNLLTKLYLEPFINVGLTYQNSSSLDSFYFADTQADTTNPGPDNTQANSTGVVNTTNSNIYNVASNTTSLTGSFKSDTEGDWETLFKFNNLDVTPSFFIDQAYFAGVQPLDSSDVSGQTGNLNAGTSGRMHRGGSATMNNNYFVDSIEGVIDTENVGAYNSGPSVDSNSGWGGRSWTYQSLGERTDVAFPPNGTNRMDDIYADGRYYMHISFGPVGVDLVGGGAQFTSGGMSNAFQPVGSPFQGIFAGAITGPNSLAFDTTHTHNGTSSTATGDVWDPTTTAGQSSLVNSDNCKKQWQIQDPDKKAVSEKLVEGGQFKIAGSEEVFTILKHRVKRLYNHTPFTQTQKVWNGTGTEDRNDSVEYFYNIWLNNINTAGLGGSNNNAATTNLSAAVKRFGRKNNRRLLYILELDKNPNDFGLSFTWDIDSDHNIRFVEPVPTTGNEETVASPAIWETQQKEDTDLNIYYEASPAIPLSIDTDTKNTEMIAQIGSKVWCSKSGSMPTLAGLAENASFIVTDVEFGGTTANIIEFASPGLNVNPNGGAGAITNDAAGHAAQTAIYQNKTLRFFNKTGGYFSAKIFNVKEITGNYITKVGINNSLTDKKVGLTYYDCFSFGNGVESNRIQDDFNAMTIGKGAKASAVLEQDYKEENRKNGLIYSGIYNSTSGVNNLNQFIQAEKITKDLNPTYGSIQKLFQRRVDLVAFCEDKVVKILSNKDALFNADGNSQLISTNRVLGDATPFSGDYGISKNPESFAKESYRAYFTDKQRSAVLRLSMDGLTSISEAGMSDYFKDNLKNTETLVGTYDSYKNNYNLTLASSTPSIGRGAGSLQQSLVNAVTISYDESVKGWCSFKSFIPETGLSMANNYFTFDQGHPYQHHIDGTRNLFYDVVTPSTVTTVLNKQPGIIKSYNTLNYDGTAGWQGTSIITDQQSGTVNQFIEKEGKWFNYIKGNANVLDLQAFNFQGIGQTTGIEYNI